MPSYYSVPELSVIDEDLITAAVLAQLANDEKARVSYLVASGLSGTAIETIQLSKPPLLSQLEFLDLSFKNVLNIDGLQGLKTLIKLKLDNNVIETVENLSHLVNLTILDLSFNRINKIQGLETLVNLKDLHLSNNELVTLENMDNLRKLEILTVSNNHIVELSNIEYLGRFEKLRSVSFVANPIVNNPKYHGYAYSCLDLEYLDYQRVDPDLITKARDENKELVSKLKSDLTRLKVEFETSVAAQDRRTLLQTLNLAGIESLAEMLAVEPLSELEQNMKQDVEEIVAFVRDKHESNATELKEFETSLKTAKEKADRVSLENVKHSKMLLKGKVVNHQTSKEIVAALQHALMGIEMGLFERIETTIAELKRNLDELARVRNSGLEQRFAKLESGSSENASALSEFKTDVLYKMDVERDATILKIQEREWTRNRNRILEILAFCAHLEKLKL